MSHAESNDEDSPWRELQSRELFLDNEEEEREKEREKEGNERTKHVKEGEEVTKEEETREEKEEEREKIESLEKEIMDMKVELWKEITAKSELVNKLFTIEKFWKCSINSESNLIINRLFDLHIIKSSQVYQAIMSIDLSLFSQTNYEFYKQLAETLESIVPFLSRSSPKVLILINGYSGAMVAYLGLIVEQSGGAVIAKTTIEDTRTLKEHYSYLVDCGAIKINIFGSNVSNLNRGHSKCSPYDVIIVPEIGWSETHLVQQLKPGGIFINPFENNVRIKKTITGDLIQV